MKINFKKIKIENFMSFSSAELTIDNSGYILVSGRNANTRDSAVSNGSGKSSLFDAILWCLTGETVRGSKDVVNIFGNDGAVVRTEFSIDSNEFVVTRTKNHSKYKSNLFIEYNGNNVSGKGIRDSEKILEQYLGELTPEIIGAVIILGQGLPQRFTNNTPSQRKEILEKLSKSDFMIEDLKTRVADRKGELLSEKRSQEDLKLKRETVLSVKQDELKSLKDNPISLEDVMNEEALIGTIEANIKRISFEHDTLSNSLISKETDVAVVREQYNLIHKKFYEQIDALNKKHSTDSSSLSQKRSAIEHELRVINNQISQIDNMKDTCPTCGQKLVNFVRPDKTPLLNSKSEKETELANIIDDINKSESDFVENKTKLETLLNSEISDTQQSLNEKETEIRELTARIKDAETSMSKERTMLASRTAVLDNLKSKFDTYEKTIEELSEFIEKSSNEILYISNRIDECSERLSIISNMETVLKRDFRGILLGSVIDFIDSKVKEYSNVIFDNAEMSFALDGNAISIKLNGKEYENLSGGERQKVDLIVQFAIRQMLTVQTGFSCNLIVLDEIFDNLDAVGSERILDLVSAKLNDVENIFIVTHHSSISIPYDREIIIQKGDDNLSVIL